MGPTPFRRALFLSLTAACWLGKGLSTQEFERDVCEFKVSGPSEMSSSTAHSVMPILEQQSVHAKARLGHREKPNDPNLVSMHDACIMSRVHLKLYVA